MKVLYSWLADYIKDIPDFKTISNNLEKIGFSIDEVRRIGANVEGVITARVIKKEKHPNADKLSVCEVFDGVSSYTVVCGAKNVEVGQIIPFAHVGAKLSGGILQRAKIRDVESNGMICSANEIGLEEKSDGIMVLNEQTPIGLDIKKIFAPDYVFELEITPNLGYCLSHYALARELSIFFGYNLNEIKQFEFNCSAGNFSIDIKTDNCLRYCGIVIKNITNTKTPEFMCDRLKKVGLNPKNNILIDASNYVMFEFGQPSHCFDLDNIEGGIVIRMARKDEKIKTLDLSEYTLCDDIMLISDNKKPLAVAGVIGGYYSSINTKTRDILIEVAGFKPSVVRRSSKKLNIKTDSSYRFERGVDINLVDIASKRMIEIIRSLNPECEIYYYGDVKNFTDSQGVIEIDTDKINSILGTSISQKEVNDILKKFDVNFDGKNFVVPTYRSDIENIWDVAEEVARYIGYDVIESKTSMPVIKSSNDAYYILKKKIMEKAIIFGFNEAINYDLISEKEIIDLGFDINDSIKLANPLSKEFEYLRPSILPSVLKNARYNLNRGIKSIKIMEFGNVFIRHNEKPCENRRLSGVLVGLKDEWEYWKEKEDILDFFYLKTFVDYILCDFDGVRLVKGSNEKYMVEDVSMEIYLRNKKIGFCGMLNPDISNIFDIKAKEIFYFDIDFDALASNYKTDFALSIKKPKAVSQFQYGVRDLSFIVDKKYSYYDIYKILLKTKDIADIRLIDVYDGKSIESDKKSFTFRFIFSSMKKTFTDDELNKKIEEIINLLADFFGARLR